jgi:dipeptidyl aminopeptidase/acylaminoacyl peptidase
MFRSVRVSAAAFLLASAATLQAQPKSALEADAIAFGTREAVSYADLSPDGSRAVMVGAGPGRSTIVYLADIAAGSVKPIFHSKGDPDKLSWCSFVSNERLACRVRATIPSDGRGFAPPGVLIGVSRMIAFDINGSDVKELGQRASSYDVGLRQFDGSIIDWLAGDDNPETVLMTRVYLKEGFRENSSNVNRTKSGIGVVKLNVKTLKADQVEAPRQNVTEWMSDGQGQVRLLGIAEFKGESQFTDRIKYMYRPPGSRDWVDLVGYQDDEFRPLAIDATINALYALRKRSGRWALTRTILGAQPNEIVVAQHPRVDIADVIRSANGQRVIGYTYSEDYNRQVFFDPEYKALAASLRKALGGQSDVSFSDGSQDGTKVLLHAGSDIDPGRFYLFDKSRKSLGQLIESRPGLSGKSLAPVKPISYLAPDGTTVPAYLTLPPGSTGKGLPAVVLPHGGPSARDEWGFDWLPQFLAARGYAVLQPNFRGSTGYGEDWLNENGLKNWRTSIGDIAAAGRFLATSGIAAPGRVAIVGWSYGGYAALQSAIVEPDVFKAVVAVAPVTDLDLLKSQYDFTAAVTSVKNFVGSGPQLAEASPLRRAQELRVPALLVHGDLDLNVDIKHSQRMHAALQGAGKQSEYVEFKGLDHQLDDSQARALMLTKIGQLLERTIGK